MKLVYDCKHRRVVYADVGKEVADFLFYLLALPLSTVVKLLSDDKDSVFSTVGCLPNLYHSAEKIDGKYVCHDDARQAKDALLGGCQCQSAKLLLLTDGSSSSSSNGRSHSNRGGFVQPIVNYAVTDDLQVIPMPKFSPAAAVKAAIKDNRFLQEKNVQLGYDEVISDQLLVYSFL
jgi:hypothetical protein